MRILVDGQPADEVLLHLTEAEAREMRDALGSLLADPGDRHEHVSSADYQVEVTLWLDRGTPDPSSPPAG